MIEVFFTISQLNFMLKGQHSDRSLLLLGFLSNPINGEKNNSFVHGGLLLTNWIFLLSSSQITVSKGAAANSFVLYLKAENLVTPTDNFSIY